jgi:predicted amidophosphoribosyltransferase
MDWIQAALQDPESERYQGWDRDKKRHDKSRRVAIDLCDTAVTKIKQTQQLKNVFDYKQRLSALENAFAVEKKMISGKRILLFDDLYRSGATLNAIAKKLPKEGEAKAVFVLTLTRTRSKL